MSVAFGHGIDQIVAKLLVNKGVATDASLWETGSGSAWPAFYGQEPDDSDGTMDPMLNMMTVYETTPELDRKDLVTGHQPRRYGITIRIRGADNTAARVRADAIRLMLEEQCYKDTVTLEGRSYLVWSFPKVMVVPFGSEAPGSKRYLVNLNCLAVILPLPLT